MKAFVTFALVLSMVFGNLAEAALCRNWSAPVRVGELDTSMVSEASGLVASRAHPGRIYLHNDSGDGPYFYVSDANGARARRITVNNFTPRDAEDLAYGPCPGGGSCLAIGDIGDNRRARPEIQVALVREVPQFANTVQPLQVLRLRYPNGPRNAESLVLHPNGDLYIITKEEQGKAAGIAHVYRFPAYQFNAASSVAGVLEYVGALNIPQLALNYSDWGKIATGASISADGSRLLVLTYESAFEFSFNLAGYIPAAESMREGVDYNLIPLTGLPQQETIAFLPGDREFVYSTEAEDKGSAPLMKVSCAD